MATKSNPKSVSARKRTASQSTPANIGCTPAMRARPIQETLSDKDGMRVILQPVPLHVFVTELKLMRAAGFTDGELCGMGSCQHCGCHATAGYSYFKRHRNGKRDWRSERAFEFCFACLTFTEAYYRDWTPEELSARVLETQREYKAAAHEHQEPAS